MQGLSFSETELKPSSRHFSFSVQFCCPVLVSDSPIIFRYHGSPQSQTPSSNTPEITDFCQIFCIICSYHGCTDRRLQVIKLYNSRPAQASYLFFCRNVNLYLTHGDVMRNYGFQRPQIRHISCHSPEDLESGLDLFVVFLF